MGSAGHRKQNHKSRQQQQQKEEIDWDTPTFSEGNMGSIGWSSRRNLIDWAHSYCRKLWATCPSCNDRGMGVDWRLTKG